MAKLTNLNGHYMREADNARLVTAVRPFLTAVVGREPSPDDEAILTRAMPGLKERAKTLVELAEASASVNRSPG